MDVPARILELSISRITRVVGCGSAVRDKLRPHCKKR